ncbi:MAG: hypothetical protein KAS04_06745 [Candidatus Aenigmarchaeota archaeon]|nr:hypothetical protein [Candidatus Aenigmarchaeota archaeon]
MMEDIGILTSTDIVAIEQASIDMINEKFGSDFSDKMHRIDVSVQPRYAEELGMGQRNYSVNNL